MAATQDSPIGSEMMLALTFDGPQRIVAAQVPKPVLIEPQDVIVRVSLCSICGSDLHPYHEREKGLARGTVVGHEFVGTVEAVGEQVQGFHIGDRVMSPFTACCSQCFYCQKGMTCRCSDPQARLFGWVETGQAGAQPAGLHGSQAQFVRVPLADGTLVKLPEDVADEEGILLGDILSTAFFCAENGGVRSGDVVAVVGCGPVGQLAVMAAQHLGASKVFAVDGIAERRAMAERFGATPCTVDDALAAVRAATDGRGADVVLELVGASGALRLAFDLLRPAGVLSSIGVHTAPQFPFSPTDGYNKNITYRSGRCPARHYMDRLLPLVQQQRWPFRDIITHRMALKDGEHGYRIFDQKLDGCIKVVLDPWAS